MLPQLTGDRADRLRVALRRAGDPVLLPTGLLPAGLA